MLAPVNAEVFKIGKGKGKVTSYIQLQLTSVNKIRLRHLIQIQ